MMDGFVRLVGWFRERLGRMDPDELLVLRIGCLFFLVFSCICFVRYLIGLLFLSAF